MKIIEWMVSSVGLAAVVLALVSAPVQSAAAAVSGEEVACAPVEASRVSGSGTALASADTVCNNCTASGTPGAEAGIGTCACSPANCCSQGGTTWGGVAGTRTVTINGDPDLPPRTSRVCTCSC